MSARALSRSAVRRMSTHVDKESLVKATTARAMRRELRDPNHPITVRDRALFAESQLLWARIKTDVGRLIEVRDEQIEVNELRNPPLPEDREFAKKLSQAITYAWVGVFSLTGIALLCK